jgi:hypothetical protein
MQGVQMLLAIIAVNASVLGVAFFALYQFNKAVRGCGR